MSKLGKEKNEIKRGKMGSGDRKYRGNWKVVSMEHSSKWTRRIQQWTELGGDARRLNLLSQWEGVVEAEGRKRSLEPSSLQDWEARVFGQVPSWMLKLCWVWWLIVQENFSSEPDELKYPIVGSVLRIIKSQFWDRKGKDSSFRLGGQGRTPWRCDIYDHIWMIR